MKKRFPALFAAFPITIPVFAGFLVIGISYGLLMSSLGFPFYYPILISIFVFAGSMQFVAIDLLGDNFNPLNAIVMTLLINARHLFYGISLLDKYKGTKNKKLYLIYALCDETFAINAVIETPQGIDSSSFYFWITFLNQSYWVISTAIGSLIGKWIAINPLGLEFVLTALFVVLFIDQWSKSTNHLPGIIGILAALFSLFIFGSRYFMLVALILILLIFFITYKKGVNNE